MSINNFRRSKLIEMHSIRKQIEFDISKIPLDEYEDRAAILLQIEPSQRSEQEIELLLNLTKQLPYFVKLNQKKYNITNKTHYKLCKKMKILSLPKGYLIQKHGEKIEKCCILLKGKVAVFMSKNEQKVEKEEKDLSHLLEYDGISKRRVSTISTPSPLRNQGKDQLLDSPSKLEDKNQESSQSLSPQLSRKASIIVKRGSVLFTPETLSKAKLDKKDSNSDSEKIQKSLPKFKNSCIQLQQCDSLTETKFSSTSTDQEFNKKELRTRKSLMLKAVNTITSTNYFKELAKKKANQNQPQQNIESSTNNDIIENQKEDSSSQSSESQSSDSELSSNNEQEENCKKKRKDIFTKDTNEHQNKNISIQEFANKLEKSSNINQAQNSTNKNVQKRLTIDTQSLHKQYQQNQDNEKNHFEQTIIKIYKQSKIFGSLNIDDLQQIEYLFSPQYVFKFSYSTSFSSGYTFGEQGILDNNDKQPLIVCEDDWCNFAIIEKKDYIELLADMDRQDIDDKIKFLQNNMFSNLNEDQIKRIFPIFKKRKFNKNQQLFSEGECIDGIYLLKKGHIYLQKIVRVEKELDPHEKSIPENLNRRNLQAMKLQRTVTFTEIIPGEMFGEEEILFSGSENACRSCTAVCSSLKASLYYIDIRAFLNFLSDKQDQMNTIKKRLIAKTKHREDVIQQEIQKLQQNLLEKIESKQKLVLQINNIDKKQIKIDRNNSTSLNHKKQPSIEQQLYSECQSPYTVREQSTMSNSNKPPNNNIYKIIQPQQNQTNQSIQNGLVLSQSNVHSSRNSYLLTDANSQQPNYKDLKKNIFENYQKSELLTTNEFSQQSQSSTYLIQSQSMKQLTNINSSQQSIVNEKHNDQSPLKLEQRKTNRKLSKLNFHQILTLKNNNYKQNHIYYQSFSSRPQISEYEMKQMKQDRYDQFKSINDNIQKNMLQSKNDLIRYQQEDDSNMINYFSDQQTKKHQQILVSNFIDKYKQKKTQKKPAFVMSNKDLQKYVSHIHQGRDMMDKILKYQINQPRKLIVMQTCQTERTDLSYNNQEQNTLNNKWIDPKQQKYQQLKKCGSNSNLTNNSQSISINSMYQSKDFRKYFAGQQFKEKKKRSQNILSLDNTNSNDDDSFSAQQFYYLGMK